MIELIKLAKEASEKAYSPYSGYKVGAALKTKSGKIFTGANIENASYSPTVCAERVAIFTAIHSGERDFEAMTIYGKNKAYPCGVCRQVLSEFCQSDFKLLVVQDDGGYEEYTLEELLPKSFTKNNLE